MTRFNKNDRVIHNTNFPILPMLVLDSDVSNTICKLEYNNDFVSQITYPNWDLRLFPIQRPDFGFHFGFKKGNPLPEIQMPYISSDFNVSVDFYLSFLKDWGKQCKQRKLSTELLQEVIFDLSNIDWSSGCNEFIKNKIISKCLSSNFCTSYSFIEFTSIDSKEYFDYERTQQDEFDIVALTIIANILNSGVFIPFDLLLNNTNEYLKV